MSEHTQFTITHRKTWDVWIKSECTFTLDELLARIKELLSSEEPCLGFTVEKYTPSARELREWRQLVNTEDGA